MLNNCITQSLNKEIRVKIDRKGHERENVSDDVVE